MMTQRTFVAGLLMRGARATRVIGPRARPYERRDFEDAYIRTGFQDEVAAPPRLHLEPGREGPDRDAPGRRGRHNSISSFDVRRLAAAVPAPEDAGAEAAVRLLRRDDVAGAAAQFGFVRRNVADAHAERLLRHAHARAHAGTTHIIAGAALLPPGRVFVVGVVTEIINDLRATARPAEATAQFFMLQPLVRRRVVYWCDAAVAASMLGVAVSTSRLSRF